MTHPLRLWYEAETGRPAPVGPEACALCGLPSPPAGDGPGDARRTKAVFSGNFTDHDRLRGASGILCPACVAYFAYTRPEYVGRGGAAGKLFACHLRVFRSGWDLWDREDMADDLIRWAHDGVPEDAALGVTFSRKKHTLPWARVTVAGSRRPWVRLDGADTQVPETIATLIAAVADLWCHGYSKRQLAAGELDPYTLAKSADPAGDFAVVAVLRPYVGSALMDLLTYIVTEVNRERHARELAALLPVSRPLPAEGGAAAGAAERRRRPAVQEPIRPAVVGDPRGARPARGTDEREPGRVEQLGLL